MNAQIRKIMDNETAFKVIEMGEDTIQMYHCSKGGMYGWQVLAVWFHKHGYKGHYKTGGCGYSKENAAENEAFRATGKMPKGYSEGSGLDYEYRVGGNFYKVPSKMIRKYK